MRISTFLTILLVFLVGGTSLKAQVVTYSDDFSTNVDFLKTTFPSGIWQGFEVNSGAVKPDQACVVTSVGAVDGGLVFKTSNGGWEGNHDNGAFLYRTVAAGVDFEVQTKFAGGDFEVFTGTKTNYNSAGILIRNPDHSKENVLYFMWFDLFNIHSMIKSMVDGAQTEIINSMDPTVTPNYAIADYKYMKVTRVTNTFTLFLSKDAKTWVKTVSVDRPDFEAIDLQVGLTQCNFYSNDNVASPEELATYFTTGILDNFILTHDAEGNPVTKVQVNKIDNDVKAYYNNAGLIRVNSSNSTIAKVSVYTVDGRLVKMVNGSNANNCNVSMNQKGFYIVAVETSKGMQVKKISITE